MRTNKRGGVFGGRGSGNEAFWGTPSGHCQHAVRDAHLKSQILPKIGEKVLALKADGALYQSTKR